MPNLAARSLVLANAPENGIERQHCGEFGGGGNSATRWGWISSRKRTQRSCTIRLSRKREQALRYTNTEVYAWMF
jgi:hypothetical protein